MSIRAALGFDRYFVRDLGMRSGASGRQRNILDHGDRGFREEAGAKFVCNLPM
jgi:hypothetical protein